LPLLIFAVKLVSGGNWPSMSEASYGKGSHLEAMRGIAALIVVASHLVRAFSSHQLSEIWVGKPWFVFINGEAAVTFFFVLSGYVLTLRPLRSGDPLATVRGVIKRWPRLAGPVSLVPSLEPRGLPSSGSRRDHRIAVVGDFRDWISVGNRRVGHESDSCNRARDPGAPSFMETCNSIRYCGRCD
jgi:hypothetical protein